MAANPEESRALTYAAPRRAELRPVPLALPGQEGEETVELTALWSGVSRGTERLVFEGAVPEGEFERMRGPFQHGDFPFPVAYGYAWVGVEAGADPARAQAWFGLFPHQERLRVSRRHLIALPETLPPRRAVLAANMETALNVCWDAGLGPCDRVAVVGGGVLGLLVAAIAASLAGTEVTVVDTDESRADLAAALGAGFALPGAAPADADIVVHTSATAAGLKTALDLAGIEATVVEASWYGAVEPAAPLGGAFHSRRLKLVSSQVGMVSPGRRARWSHRRRLAAALALLADDRFDALVTGEVAFEDLPRALPVLLAPGADGLATAVRYL